MMDVQARRAELDERIHGLRGERGRALLDGEDFDAVRLASVEAELAALDDAEAERARRERAAANETERDRCGRLAEMILAADERRRGALDRLEAGTRQIAEAMAAHDAETATVERCLRQRGDKLLADSFRFMQPHPSALMAKIITRNDTTAARAWGQLEHGSAGSFAMWPERPFSEVLAFDFSALKETT